MGRPVIDLTGQRFGKLIVVGMSDRKDKKGSPLWNCLCDCGNATTVYRKALKSGDTKSCGKCRGYSKYDLDSEQYGIGITSNGTVFYFDKEDYDLLSKYKWWVSGKGYLYTRIDNKNLFMHRIIMNAPKNMEVDHINHNKLDNRKDNLRICTHSQNCMNKKINGFTQRGNKFEVNIRIDGQQKYIGKFNTKEEAIAARIANYDEDHKIFAMEV